jgi:hypothetical protein
VTASLRSAGGHGSGLDKLGTSFRNVCCFRRSSSLFTFGPLAQIARARGRQPRGHWCEPSTAHFDTLPAAGFATGAGSPGGPAGEIKSRPVRSGRGSLLQSRHGTPSRNECQYQTMLIFRVDIRARRMYLYAHVHAISDQGYS